MQPMAPTHTQVCEAAAQRITLLSPITTVALHLARRLTVPPWVQLRNGGPSSRWFQSQRYSRGELRAAAQAAISTNTVVGMPGTITPTTARPRQSTANACSTQRNTQGSGRGTGMLPDVLEGSSGFTMNASIVAALQSSAGVRAVPAVVCRGHASRGAILWPDTARCAADTGPHMTIHTILKMGDPRLLRVAQPVQEFGTDALRTLVQDMFDTMRAVNGAGLAAPQIGVDLQLVIFGSQARNPRYPDRPLVPPTVLLNPVITPIGEQEEEDWEGCLSVPGLRGKVPRWARIRYTGFDVDGAPIDRTVEGFHARVVQHECDHLIGKLYPMRVRDFTQFGFTEVLFPEIDATEDD